MNCMCCSYCLQLPTSTLCTCTSVLVIIKLVTLCTMVVLYWSVEAPPCKLDHVKSTVTPTWPQTTVHTSAGDSGRPRAYSAGVGGVASLKPWLLSVQIDNTYLILFIRVFECLFSVCSTYFLTYSYVFRTCVYASQPLYYISLTYCCLYRRID